jgi:hypothetical protein
VAVYGGLWRTWWWWFAAENMKIPLPFKNQNKVSQVY